MGVGLLSEGSCYLAPCFSARQRQAWALSACSSQCPYQLGQCPAGRNREPMLSGWVSEWISPPDCDSRAESGSAPLSHLCGNPTTLQTGTESVPQGSCKVSRGRARRRGETSSGWVTDWSQHGRLGLCCPPGEAAPTGQTFLVPAQALCKSACRYPALTDSPFNLVKNQLCFHVRLSCSSGCP